MKKIIWSILLSNVFSVSWRFNCLYQYGRLRNDAHRQLADGRDDRADERA